MITGRDKILKFEGSYHGHGDSLLIKAGSGVATLGLPDSPGVPADIARNTLMKQFLANWFDLPVETFSSYLTIREEDEAIEHLFKVTAGIDSMVLGETQILGQVKKSFLSGQEIGTTGTVYNQLFKQAVTFAKRAHNETAIGENAVSVSYAAVELVGSFKLRLGLSNSTIYR